MSTASFDLAYVDIEVTSWPDAIVVVETGVQGPAGPSGTGSGSGSGAEFKYIQSAYAATWTVVHNLERHPSVRIVDQQGDLIWTDVQYVDANTIVIKFAQPTIGTVYLN